jgi:hypothetical protein
MKSISFGASTSKRSAFEVCKKVLHDFADNIISSDFSTGIIEANKDGNLLSYGHKISLSITANEKGKIEISVTSHSVGLQLIDWGTNSENEDKLITLIENALR